MRSIKTPTYTVITRSKTIETRNYKPMLTATVSVSGDRKTAINNGFRQLAGFIFGDNQQQHQSKKIAMTAPVIQQPESITMTAPVLQQGNTKNRSWDITFVMPKQYNQDTLPKPNNPAIKIHPIPQQNDTSNSL